MGFHVSWITIRGIAPEAVREQLQLRETGEREELPESDIVEALLPSGWQLIFFNDPCPEEIEDKNLKALSAGCEVMAFVVEECSMTTLATSYVNGDSVWHVAHDSDSGLEHMEVTGTPPVCFSEIYSKLLAELKADENPCDYLFDVPAELSKVLTGFRHDCDIEGADGDVFSILEKT
jgi:hypothetical protein